MNSVEEKLWAYIDGTCTTEESKAIELLIETDEAYRHKFDELMAFDAELAEMEIDEPSMAFTYNVMEGVRAEHARNPLKSAINPAIIKGICVFFILTISAILFLVLSSVQWGGGAADVKLAMPFKPSDIAQFASPTVIKAFLFFDVVLGLFLLDAWLRRENVAKHA